MMSLAFPQACTAARITELEAHKACATDMTVSKIQALHCWQRVTYGPAVPNTKQSHQIGMAKWPLHSLWCCHMTAVLLQASTVVTVTRHVTNVLAWRKYSCHVAASQQCAMATLPSQSGGFVSSNVPDLSIAPQAIYRSVYKKLCICQPRNVGNIGTGRKHGLPLD